MAAQHRSYGEQKAKHTHAPTRYRLRMRRKWKHVLLRQCCSRTEPSGIVAKANIHTLRVAGKHLRLASVHAMPTYRNYANKSNSALSRNPVAHDSNSKLTTTTNDVAPHKTNRAAACCVAQKHNEERICLQCSSNTIRSSPSTRVLIAPPCTCSSLPKLHIVS